MRKVCIVTGTRAEFGLLSPLMHQISAHPALELQVIATGAHLSAAHGGTLAEIEAQEFIVDETVHMLLASDSPEAVGTSLGLGVIGLTRALSRLSPDIVVLLGDRYEALAAAQSAMVLGLPIAHIHGGEATEGLIDEAIRHSITKMAHLHFVAAAQFRDRVIQLGEEPSRVHIVGAAGLDNIAALERIDRAALSADLGLPLGTPLLAVTYHPVTLKGAKGGDVRPLLAALDRHPQATIVFTGSNADAHGGGIDTQIAGFCARNPERAVHVASLGFRRYLSLLAEADAVVGNSSSGLLEAPYMAVPTVNIGPRQQGRPRAPSVIDCENADSEIATAIETALSPAHKTVAARRESPYGRPGAAEKMAAQIARVDVSGMLFKRFYTKW